MSSTNSFVALGLRRTRDSKTLDVLYPFIHSNTDLIDAYKSALPEPVSNGFKVLSDDELHALISIDSKLESFSIAQGENDYYESDMILFVLDDASKAVESVEEAFFKLQCLSQRQAKPHSLCLDALFGTLHNIAWTNKGPILTEDLAPQRLKYQASGSPLQVSHIDKFPYLVDYHYPSGVRIASGSQVRLGAYLGEGSTVMPAGYVNFNAGTLGNAMVEGRVSAGVVVGANSDVGGGASIMGTLSGGNSTVISIGEQCLLGANAGTGISLGKGCTIAAGLYVYAGMKVSLYNADNAPVNAVGDVVSEGDNVLKASELSGRDYLLFIMDSQSGKVLCKPNKKLITLNDQLHHND